MKRLALAATVAGLLLLPGIARAGAATDAALGLGAFAVFNQILSGTGVFGGLLGRPAVVVAPPPPVTIYQPAPVVYAPPPPVVIVRPAPIFAPRGGYYAPAPIYRHAPRPVPVA